MSETPPPYAADADADHEHSPQERKIRRWQQRLRPRLLDVPAHWNGLIFAEFRDGELWQVHTYNRGAPSEPDMR